MRPVAVVGAQDTEAGKRGDSPRQRGAIEGSWAEKRSESGVCTSFPFNEHLPCAGHRATSLWWGGGGEWGRRSGPEHCPPLNPPQGSAPVGDPTATHHRGRHPAPGALPGSPSSTPGSSALPHLPSAGAGPSARAPGPSPSGPSTLMVKATCRGPRRPTIHTVFTRLCLSAPRAASVMSVFGHTRRTLKVIGHRQQKGPLCLLVAGS